MASRKTVPSPRHCRRSLDPGTPTGVLANSLRQEQSSPAVVQQADFSLVRTVVSASGQGAGALLKGPGNSVAIWRTRSVRNKTESYCILQLKQPARGITVQITFASAATTPREIRLLHAIAVNGTFKPLAAQHCMSATGVQQVQHSLAVSPNIQVQRYLKVEMQGQAVAATSGACHAVCQLDVVQLSALATASAAQATQLPVPVFDSPAPSAVTDISADVLLSSPTEEAVQDITPTAGTQQIQAAPAQQQQHLQQQQKQQPTSILLAEGDSQRFNSWLDQTRSSLQQFRRSSGSFNRAAATAADVQSLPGSQQEQPPQTQQLLSEQAAAPPELQRASVAAAGVNNQQAQQQQQQHRQSEQQPATDLQVTLEANRQQLLQLQKQYQLLSKIPQPPQQVGQDLQTPTLQRPLLVSMPRVQAAGPAAAAAVLTAAGRPSTVLSMLKCSDSWSDDHLHNHSSSTLSASMDSAFFVEPCRTPEGPSAAAAEAAAGTCTKAASAGGTPVEPPASVADGQQWQQASMVQDESAVLMGSLIYEPGLSCDSHALPAPPPYAAAEDAAGCRSSSSCSVHGPAGGEHCLVDDLLDDASSLGGDSIINPMFGDMPASIVQLAVAGQVRASDKGSLEGPVLVDSQSCLPSGSNRQPRSDGQTDGSPVADRKVQSCPAISPQRDSSGNSSDTGPAAGPSNPGCRLHTTGSSQQQVTRSPHGTASLLGAAAGVTLSPEIMRRGQLVKQSCPTFSFPRYNSHSPAKLSKEGILPTAAAAAADGEESDDDQEPADVSPRRSRLAQVSSSREWQQQQQPVRELFTDAEDGIVQHTRRPVQRSPAAEHSSTADAAAAADDAGSGTMFSPVFEPQQALASCEAHPQQPAQQGVQATMGAVSTGTAPVPAPMEPTAEAAVPAAQSQPQPVQHNSHNLLQALLFSSCDFGSSVDLGQAAPQQQGLPNSAQQEHDGYDSPKKLQQQPFWDQQRDQQQVAVVDDVRGSLSALVAASVPQLTQAIGGVILSPIAESPEVSRPLATPGSDLGPSSAGSESKCKSRLAAAAGSDEQHDLQQMDQAKPQQVPESLQQLLALSRMSAEAQLVNQPLQHQQPLQEHPHQPLMEQPSREEPGPQPSNRPHGLQQPRLDNGSLPSTATNSQGESSVCAAPQHAASAADPAAVAGHFSRAAGRAGGPAGYHRITSQKQRQQRNNGTSSLKRMTAAGVAVPTAGFSAASGSFTARSADVLPRTLAQQQQQRGGSLRASAASTSSHVSRPTRPAGATAGSQAASESTVAGASRRHSTGSLAGRGAQAAPVRTSHLKLDLLQPGGASEPSSMVSAGSGNSSTTGGSAGSAAASGAAASGRGRGAAKYEQLLKSQFGKAPALRSSQPGSSVSKQAQPPVPQVQATSTRPVTTSICLADLFAANTGQLMQHGASGVADAGTAVTAGSSRSGSGDVMEQLHLCLGDMMPEVDPALQLAGVAIPSGVNGPGEPYQLQRPSSRQWHDQRGQPAQLPFIQQSEISASGCIQPQQQKQPQQFVLTSRHQHHQQPQDVGHHAGSEQAGKAAAGTSPASPDKQLNLFLPKLVQSQLLTPRTLEHPSRHANDARHKIEDSVVSRGVHRGPSPSTPEWLGMASPKSGTKQQHVHDSTSQQGGMECQLHIHQVPEQLEPQHVGQQLQGQQSRPLQAAEAEQQLVMSIDAAIEAASASLGAPSQRSSTSSAGSAAQQHSAGHMQLAAGQEEPAVSLPPPAAPAIGGEGEPAAAAAAYSAHAAQQQVQADAHHLVAQPAAGDLPAAGGAACSSPTRTPQRPSARSCPLIASPIRASQVARQGPAVVGSYQLQTVCLDTAEPAGSTSAAVQPTPAEATVVTAAVAAAATSSSSNPVRSTIIVSIVKHARSGQQQQVQLQQRYVFEAQPIQDIVQLDTPAGIDSCASCSSSIAPAGDCLGSVEGQMYYNQYAAAANSPAGTEVSMAACRPAAATRNLAAAVAAAAHEEEVASSDEPIAGHLAAEASVASGAVGDATSPGSCGSAVSSSSPQRQHHVMPGRLLRQAAGQPRSRLGLHQLAAANSAVAAAESAAGGSSQTPATADRNQQPQHQPSSTGATEVDCKANAGVAADQPTSGEAANGSAAAAADQHDHSSPNSFCTASSQMGTVWPHQHHHSAGVTTNASIASGSSGSSVCDTGLHHQHPRIADDRPHAVSKRSQQYDAEAQTVAGQDTVGGVQLARSFYHRSSQHSGQSSAAATSRATGQHSSHPDVAVSQSLSGTHSLWDETDPVADDVPAAGAGSSPAAAEAHSSIRASHGQLQQMPHRVQDSAAGVTASVERAVQPGCSANCSIGQVDAAARGGSVLIGSIYRSMDGSVLSDVSVVSDADSASSAAGPPKQQAVGASPATDDEAQASAGGSQLPQQQQHEGLQHQQQHEHAETNNAAEQAASASLSFAAMHQPHSSYSSHYSTPGKSSTAAPSAAPKRHPAAAEAAVADSTPTGPAARSAACPAAQHEPLAHSQEDSVGSSGSAPMQAGPSSNDVAVDESQKTAGSKKDQSPNKTSGKDQSPDKPQASKSATSPGEVVTSHESCDRKVAAIAPAAAVRDQYVIAEDAASVNSKSSHQRATAAAVRKPPVAEQQQQRQQLSPYSPRQQQQASPQLLAQQGSTSRPRQPPQLQVVVPGSPKAVRPMASTAVCFSPLHAARASRGSVGSMGPGISSPGRHAAPVAPFAQLPVALAPSVVQPALSGDSTTAPAAAAASTAEVSSTAAAAAPPVAGSAKQPAAAGGASPYTGFSPLHSMLPGSGSDGRVSSKTHSRTKKGSPGQEDEVTVVRKNLMVDMLRAAAAGTEVPAILGYALATARSNQLPDTHSVRDSKVGTAAAAGRLLGLEQPGTILQTPVRPHSGSVLDKVALQLPAVGLSPQVQQQLTSLGDGSSLASEQRSQETLSEFSQPDLQQQVTPALTAEGSLMQQWSSGVLPQESSGGVASESGHSDSLQLMCQSSVAAAAALRAAAATPAPIPCHSSLVDEEDLHTENDQPPLPDQKQQQQHSDPGATGHDKGSSAGSSLAVVSVDGAIPPVTAVVAPQKSIIAQLQPAAAAQQQHVSGIKPAAAAAAPNSDGKVVVGGTGPLNAALRRHNIAGALSRILATGTPASGVAALVGPEDSNQAACSPANAGAAALVPEAPAETIGQTPAVSGVTATADRAKQQQQVAPAAAGPKAAGSPYLQQLQEHSAQAQQLRGVTASPLSTHRHHLQFRMQQLVSPRSPASGTTDVGAAAVPSLAAVRSASSLGHHSPVTPSRPSCSSSQQTGDTFVPAGTATATDANAGQGITGVTRGSSCGGRISPNADGANSGAARMGRLRHRRARSDMPEYYPLSPLESPLHTAMPEDEHPLNMCEITLSPQVSAAAAAALAAAETPESAVNGAGGVGRLLIAQVPVEPVAGPLGSPLRHGLLSPAAMYRIQQQQLKEQASQQQLGAEQSAAAVASPVASPAVSREPSKADVQQKQQGVAQAVADAVAAYEGSISPRRLAKIQEYVSGLVSVDVGGSILDQHTPQHNAVADVVAASTPGKDSDAFDSFNLNNQLNLQAELEQHGQQLEQQQQQQQAEECKLPGQQQPKESQLNHEELSAQTQQVVEQDQLQDQLTPRQELSSILAARLSRCSSSTVRASVEALLAAKIRSSSSSTASRGSSRPESVALAAAGVGECATAVAQLLQADPESMLSVERSDITELPFEHSGGCHSGSHASSVAAPRQSEQQLNQQQQQPPPLTAARLRQHSLGSNSSHQSSNQRYQLNGELSYASSAAASHAELLQAAAVATAAGDKSLLASIQELLEAPALVSASTDTMDFQPHTQLSTDQLHWPHAPAGVVGSRRSLGYRQSQDSQQEAVMQSHGALLGPSLTELSTAAGGTAVADHRPASSAPKAAAAPAGHALAGGIFRRSAQLLAGLAHGLMQPADVGSVESTAGSMAVGSKSLSSRATGAPNNSALRQSHGCDRIADDEEFTEQLRASVNMVAGSLDISGPQVVRLTQQLWLNRLLPEAVPEGESLPTAATAGSNLKSTTTGLGLNHLATAHQHRQQQAAQGVQQPARGAHGGAPPQAQMGPLLAGRLAAMAAMRQLRRSSVGESPDIVANGRNLPGSRRSLSSLAGSVAGAGFHGSIADSRGSNSQYRAQVGNAPNASGSQYLDLHAAAPAAGGGIGRGRLSAAAAALPGALTSSNSFGSGGGPSFIGEQQQSLQPQVPVIGQLGSRQGQLDRHNVMRASVASVISNDDGFYNQEPQEADLDANNSCLGACQQTLCHSMAGAGAGGHVQSLNGQASEILQQLLWGEESDSR